MEALLDRLVKLYIKKSEKNLHYFFIPLAEEMRMWDGFNLFSYLMNSIISIEYIDQTIIKNKIIVCKSAKSLSRLSNHNNILFLVETNQDNVIREDNDFAELEEVQIIQL